MGALGRDGMYPSSTSIGLSNAPAPHRAGLASGVAVVRLRRYPGDQPQPFSRHHRHHYDTATSYLSNAAANTEVAETSEEKTDEDGTDVAAVENAFGELEGALWAGPARHCPPRHCPPRHCPRHRPSREFIVIVESSTGRARSFLELDGNGVLSRDADEASGTLSAGPLLWANAAPDDAKPKRGANVRNFVKRQRTAFVSNVRTRYGGAA